MQGYTGFRGVVRILSYLNKALKLGLEALPSKSSIENWVQKAGYYIYETVEEGQEPMLAVLGVPATKTDAEALKLSDVSILGLHVKPSWTSDSIQEAIVLLQLK